MNMARSESLLPASQKAAETYLKERRGAIDRLGSGGRLPERLNELVPQFLASIPIDLFSGSALHFRRLERGYVVYSAGSDRHDDGGTERVSKGTPKPYDETFIVER